MAKKLLRANSRIKTNGSVTKKMHVGKVGGKDVYANFMVIEGVTHMIRNSTMNGLRYGPEVFDELSDRLMTSNARIPAPLSHPSDEDGNFMDANDPITFSGHSIHAFDTDWRVNGDKLQSNTYINMDFAKSVPHADWLVNRLENKEPIDRSTGLYLDIDYKSNGMTPDGETYSGDVTKIYELNHSAILNPDIEPGAKNNNDGVGMYTNSDGIKVEIEECNLEINASNPALNLPLAPPSTKWDASEAEKRIRAYTDSTDSPSSNYRRFFMVFDRDDVESFGAYKLPFADIIDGKPHAVKAAIDNAKARLDQTDISDADKAAAMKVIERYQAKFDDVEKTNNSSIWSKIKQWLVGNKDLSHSEIHELIYEKLNSGRGDSERAYPYDVYPSYFIYRSQDDKLYQQSYRLDSDDVVFDGEPVEVERVVEYKPVTNGDREMRDKILAALNAAKVETNGLDDEQLLAAYNELQAKPTGEDGSGQQQNNSEEAPAWAKELTAKVNSMETKLNANSDKEREAKVKAVANHLDMPEDAVKGFTDEALNAAYAKTGTSAFNHAGVYKPQGDTSGIMNMQLPESEEEYK